MSMQVLLSLICLYLLPFLCSTFQPLRPPSSARRCSVASTRLQAWEHAQNILADATVMTLAQAPASVDVPLGGAVGAVSVADPVIQVAVGVALVALSGLVAFQEMDAVEESSATTATSTAPTKSSTTTSEFTKPIVLEETKKEQTPISVVTSSSDENASRIMDDLTQEEDKAFEAFNSGNGGGLRASLGRLVGLVRSTRSSLQDQTNLREEAQAQLTQSGEQLRDMEDKYELEQNALQRMGAQLQETQTSLQTTNKQLQSTTDSLVELQEERKSLRKLGRVAWKLSKQRVQTRIEKIRNRD